MEMEDVRYCILCLVTNVKMFKMNSAMLRTYKELISTQNELVIQQFYACYECAYLLHKYATFKAKCCKAYSILWTCTAGSFKITEENLKCLDRNQHNLNSELTIASISTKYYFVEQQHEPCGIDKKITGDVKSELVGGTTQEQDNDNLSTEPLQQMRAATHKFHNVLIKKDHPQCSDEQIKTELFIEVAEKDDVEDVFHTVDIMETASSDNDLHKDAGALNEEHIKMEPELTFPDTHAINKDQECSKSNIPRPNNSNIIDVITRCPIKRKIINKEIHTSKRKKRKLEGQNSKNMCQQENHKKTRIINDNISNATTKAKCNNRLVNDSTKLETPRPPKISKNNNLKLSEKNKTNRKSRCFFDPSIYKDYANIVELTPEEARRDVLLRKESLNYKRCAYKCELCYRGFNMQATYQTHMNKHSLEHGSHECDICQLRFFSKRDLRCHLLNIHIRKFICKICPYVSNGSNQAINHMSLHKGKEYVCKECGEKFRYPNSLLTHRRIKHNVELACDLCGNSFGSAKGLEVHKKLLHRKERNEYLGPKCDECDVHFTNATAWKRHLVLCSKHKLSHGCSVCGEIFADAIGLRRHARDHGPRVQYPQSAREKAEREVGAQLPARCTHCERVLTTKKEYNNHITTEHPDTEIAEKIMKLQRKNCVCEVCGMTFAKHCLLVKHQWKHTGEKPFSCDHCGKKFTTMHALKAHQPVHTKVYPFKCHICNKEFGNKGRFKKHVNYHTAERQHKCTGCDRMFMFPCEMKYHAMYVHNKVPWPKRDRNRKSAENTVDMEDKE